MNAQRMVFLVLAVLALLFFCGIGAGALRGGNGSADLQPSWVQGLGHLLPGPPHLTAADLTPLSACFRNGRFTMAPAGTCQVQVNADTGHDLRRLDLAFQQGDRVTVTLETPGRFTQTQDFPPPGDDQHLDAPKDGGTLTMRCLSAGACVVDLQ